VIPRFDSSLTLYSTGRKLMVCGPLRFDDGELMAQVTSAVITRGTGPAAVVASGGPSAAVYPPGIVPTSDVETEAEWEVVAKVTGLQPLRRGRATAVGHVRVFRDDGTHFELSWGPDIVELEGGPP
jgi:hypothetical protein